MGTRFGGFDVDPGDSIIQRRCDYGGENLNQKWSVNVDGDYHEIRNGAHSLNGLPQCLAVPGGNAIIGWQLESTTATAHRTSNGRSVRTAAVG
jgi:hypothetical protein